MEATKIGHQVMLVLAGSRAVYQRESQSLTGVQSTLWRLFPLSTPVNVNAKMETLRCWMEASGVQQGRSGMEATKIGHQVMLVLAGSRAVYQRESQNLTGVQSTLLRLLPRSTPVNVNAKMETLRCWMEAR